VNKRHRTQCNHERRLKDHISTVFYWLEHGQWTQETFLAHRQERIYQTNAWKRLPQYRQAYFQGIMDERMRVFLKDHTVYCVVWNDTPITIKEWESLWSTDKPWRALEDCVRGTYYKDSRKPFYTSPAPNTYK
jgi:hypothetical protein